MAGSTHALTRLALAGLLLVTTLQLARHAPAASPVDEATGALLVEAVEAAFALDLYNDRCRSDRSGRHIDNLNKTLASKLRITVLGVQDDLFPERSYRRAQARMQEAFLARLQELGGCSGAKTEGLLIALRERYDAALARVSTLP